MYSISTSRTISNAWSLNCRFQNKLRHLSMGNFSFFVTYILFCVLRNETFFLFLHVLNKSFNSSLRSSSLEKYLNSEDFNHLIQTKYPMHGTLVDVFFLYLHFFGHFCHLWRVKLCIFQKRIVNPVTTYYTKNCLFCARFERHGSCLGHILDWFNKTFFTKKTRQLTST